jgi:hypothetical protein
MNVMPVANQREGEQQKCDQQQSGRFRCIDRVAALFVRVALGLRGRHADFWRRHADIVALGERIPTAAVGSPTETAEAAVSTGPA